MNITAVGLAMRKNVTKINRSMITRRLFSLFLKGEIIRIPYMRSRGFRSINLTCCIIFIIFIIFTLILILIIPIIRIYIVYNNFVQTFPFSTVPFWKDNRTINKKPLLPVLKVENVNLSSATIAIAACCRNVRKHLVGFQRNTQAITALFGIYRIYLYESDSRDKTLAFLNEWQKNDSDHVRVQSKGNQRWRVTSRKCN